jgi:hypothetical protein
MTLMKRAEELSRGAWFRAKRLRLSVRSVGRGACAVLLIAANAAWGADGSAKPRRKPKGPSELVVAPRAGTEAGRNAPAVIAQWVERVELDGRLVEVIGEQLRDAPSGRESTTYRRVDRQPLPEGFARAGQKSWATLPVVEVRAKTRHAPLLDQPKLTPRSLAGNLYAPIPTIRLEAPDLAAVLLEDQALSHEGKARRRVSLRRGLPAPIHVRSKSATAGVWQPLAEGGRLWAIELESAEAEAVRVRFEAVSLPAGASLLVYASEHPSEGVGPYGGEALRRRMGSGALSGPEVSRDPRAESSRARQSAAAERSFWSESVFAPRVTIECHVPAGTDPAEVTFTIRELSHRYVKVREAAGQPAQVGACQIDVSCRPEWIETARAVALVNVMRETGEDQCTGCLIADADPASTLDYFYTANHCIGNQAEAETAEFFWLYQTPSCNAPPPNLANVPRTGGGAEFLAGMVAGPGSDFSLVRLRQRPPGTVTYAGWSTASLGAGDAAVVIHHPQGQNKHITFGGVESFWANFYLAQWTSGSTEPGSSGAPVFNAEKKLVGQLRGGSASCDFPEGLDTCGRFDVAFPIIRDWLLNQPVIVPNDNFLNAHSLQGGAGTVAVNSSGAGKELGEPDHAGDSGGRSVWFRWTAPTDGAVTFDTVGSSIDTLLAVYSGGSLATLSRVASNDDFSAGKTSRVSFTTASQASYFIAVDGFAGTAGAITLNWQPGALSNDQFHHAQLLSGGTGEINGANFGQSKEPGEPSHAGNPGGKSIWYRWVAPANASVTFDTEGSLSIDPQSGGFVAMDTLLAVYTGSTVASLSLVADNDDINGADGIVQSRVTFSATAGREYFIAVDGAQIGDQVEEGFGLLTWHQAPGAGVPAPANNDFAAAQQLVGDFGAVRGSNVKATREPSEPTHTDTSGGKSIWYRWRAPGKGLATFDTIGSDFDTVLAVYRGDTLGSLTAVGSNDDVDNFVYQSRATFPTTAGTEYRIMVDGFLTDGGTTREGDATLNWAFVPDAGGNDAFANARLLPGTSGRVDSTNVGATKEAGEPLHAGNPGGSSVWFRWTAPVAGPVVFDTLGSTIDTALAVYVGSRVDELTLVLSDDDIDQDGGVYQSRVRFVARAGVEYRIAVDGFSDGAGPAETGSIVLNWTQTSLAPITLTAPLVLGGGSFRFTLAGTPGTYAVEVSADLANWSVVGSVVNTTGTTQFTDTATSGTSRRFYRARLSR